MTLVIAYVMFMRLSKQRVRASHRCVDRSFKLEYLGRNKWVFVLGGKFAL